MLLSCGHPGLDRLLRNSLSKCFQGVSGAVCLEEELPWIAAIWVGLRKETGEEDSESEADREAALRRGSVKLTLGLPREEDAELRKAIRSVGVRFSQYDLIKFWQR